MLRLFITTLIAILLGGCVNHIKDPITTLQPQDHIPNYDYFQFSAHKNMALILENILLNKGVVRLAIVTDFNTDWVPGTTEEMKKLASKGTITNFDTSLTIEMRNYFKGNKNFSIVDPKALTPIDKANYLLQTYIEYTVDQARYWGKLIDIKNETTIGNYYCSHGETESSVQCY